MRGIYSFVLVFAFIFFGALLAGTGAEIGKSMSAGLETALEAERASFARFQLEENTDFVVRQIIESEILAGNTSGGLVNKRIAEGLERLYFESGEKNSGIEIKFFESRVTSSGFIPGEMKKPLKGIEKYCKTVIVRVKENVFLARFEFTGGLMKNTAITGQISAGKARQFFRLLPGYSIEEVVVA